MPFNVTFVVISPKYIQNHKEFEAEILDSQVDK